MSLGAKLFSFQITFVMNDIKKSAILVHNWTYMRLAFSLKTRYNGVVVLCVYFCMAVFVLFFTNENRRFSAESGRRNQSRLRNFSLSTTKRR